MNLRCPACGSDIAFEQPYAYHAGFSNQGFLYNDAGNATLVWSSFDPYYVALVGDVHPWMLDPDKRTSFEGALTPAPDGGAWRFANPPRCPACAAAIAEPPATGNIYYFVYPSSVICDGDRATQSLRSALKPCT